MIYELSNLGSALTADSVLPQLSATRKAPNNVPITTITPLSNPSDLDAAVQRATPTPLSLAYRISLPSLSGVAWGGAGISGAAAAAGAGYEGADSKGKNEWLEMFALASERNLVLEVDLAPRGEIVTGIEKGLERRREELEELLGKAYEAEVKANGGSSGSEEKPLPTQEEEQEVLDDDEEQQASKKKDEKAVKIVIDGMGAPPNLPSSSLLRSPELEQWAGFISVRPSFPIVFLSVLTDPNPLSVHTAADGTAPARIPQTLAHGPAAIGSNDRSRLGRRTRHDCRRFHCSIGPRFTSHRARIRSTLDSFCCRCICIGR